MIWDSVIIMTVADLVIICLTLIAFWYSYQNRQLLKHLNVFSGLALVLGGLVMISSLYFLDIVTMHLLPGIMPFDKAMAIMQTLHLNYSWILFTLFLLQSGSYLFLTIGRASTGFNSYIFNFIPLSIIFQVNKIHTL